MFLPLFRQHYPVAYLLRVLVLAILLPIISGFTIFVVNDYRERRHHLLQDNTERAQLLGQEIDNHIMRTQAMARSFAGAEEILAGDLTTFSQRAAGAIRAAGLGSHIFVYRLDGGRVLRYSSTDDRFIPTQENTSAPRAVLEGGVSALSDLFTDPASGDAYVSAHVPVKVNGNTMYSVAIGIPTRQLTALLLEHELPRGWLASLTDRQGMIAGRSRLSEKFVGQPANTTLRMATMTSDTGTLDTVTKDGIQNLTAFSRSSITGYTTIIGVPNEEITGPLRRNLIILVGVFFSLMALGLIFARFTSRLISRSVQALINPAIALGNGTSSDVDRVYLTEAYEVATAMGRAAELLGRRDAVLLAQREELQKFYFFSENSNELILLLDQDGNIRYANQMASRRLGYSDEELLTTTIFQIDRQSTPSGMTAIFASCRSTQVLPFERQYQCKDGSFFPVEITATVLEYRGEWLMHVAPRDISERVQSEYLLRWTAAHDALTGLSNRAAALAFISDLFTEKHNPCKHGAVLYIDLDRFKPVNDLYSHAVGDRILVEVARRMQSLMHDGDVLARVGGDEFVAILVDGDLDGDKLIRTVQALIDVISAPINLENIQVKLSASVGISCFPEHGDSPDALIHAADLAMLRAKECGRNTYIVYSPVLDEHVQFVTSVERRLRQALDKGHFALHFQPILNLASGTIDGVESLVRLVDGMEPPLGPSEFIPIAETCGLIAPLDHWAALEACRQQVIWRDAGIDLHISINVSALQFQRANFIQQMRDVIEATGIDPRSLIIELTETAMMENLAEATQILGQLKTMGIRIALDDFGTGYSSLSTLSNLPIDKIKIDQSFTRRMATDGASCAIIDTIIALAKTLRLELVAEGIETEAALHYLHMHGCELGQGYYFSRPLTPAAFVRWYEAWNERNR